MATTDIIDIAAEQSRIAALLNQPEKFQVWLAVKEAEGQTVGQAANPYTCPLVIYLNTQFPEYQFGVGCSWVSVMKPYNRYLFRVKAPRWAQFFVCRADRVSSRPWPTQPTLTAKEAGVAYEQAMKDLNYYPEVN